MTTRLKTANLVIVVSVGLAAVALLMLGWIGIQSTNRSNLPAAMLLDPDAWRRMLLVVAVIVSGIVAVLLWALIYNSRACHRAETRLEGMSHRLPGGFYVFRLTDDGMSNYEFLTVNAANVLGISREQVMKDPGVARRLVVVEDRERVNVALVQSHAALSPMEIDFRIRKPDGEIRWVRTLAVPARASGNDVVWNGHLFDITDIRSTEQALRETTQRLEDAQRVARFGDWTCELATGEVTWSQQVYRLLDRDPALGPPNLTEVIDLPLEGPEPMANAFELAQATGESQSFEASTRLSDGEVVTLDVIVLPVADAEGNVTGMRGTMQDITSRKALEERLSLAKEAADATNRAKSAFLATMSHEIRTPLNGMLGLLELISLTPVNPEIHTALEAVRDSGQSLQRIIDDILDFSKIEAGKLQIFPEPTRVSDLIGSVHRIYSGSATSLGLEFRQYIDPEISPVLMLDAMRLRQILSNFISNAIKFTSSGSVELRVLSEGHDSGLQCLRFEVVDTGIGISPEEQRKLFQEFEQAQNVASRFGGTGLGLSISQRLAELMGGHVGMTSTLGAGTTMTLHLVALVANPALAPSLREPHQAAPMAFAVKLPEAEAAVATDTVSADSGTVILVVDDHPTNRMVMRKQADTLGYAVVDVEDGAEALEQWRTGKFALVLTDLNMPGMSGYELSRAIRQEEESHEDRRIPIIACSANAIPGVREDCMQAGMDDYIAKPIRLMELREKLTTWLPAAAQHGDASPHLPEVAAETANEENPSNPMAPDSPLHVGRRTNELGITKQVLAHFRQVNDVDVKHLLEAVQGNDLATVTRMAHRIKGACGFIGATELAAICGMIEHAGRDEDEPGVTWLIDVFHMELEQLNASLDA